MADFIFPVTLTAQPSFNPIPPGLFEGGSPWEGGGEAEMKFGEVIKDH